MYRERERERKRGKKEKEKWQKQSNEHRKILQNRSILFRSININASRAIRLDFNRNTFNDKLFADLLSPIKIYDVYSSIKTPKIIFSALLELHKHTHTYNIQNMPICIRLFSKLCQAIYLKKITTIFVLRFRHTSDFT